MFGVFEKCISPRRFKIKDDYAMVDDNRIEYGADQQSEPSRWNLCRPNELSSGYLDGLNHSCCGGKPEFFMKSARLMAT